MLAERKQRIEQKIEHACRRTGRKSSDVHLIAVTKTQTADLVNHAITAGLTRIGENRVQEYFVKLPHLLSHEFHFVGHLQKNKVKAILPYCHMIHTIDSLSLAAQISKCCTAMKTMQEILIEVNVSAEESKFGVPYSDAIPFTKEIAVLPNIAIRGYMTIASFESDAEKVRPQFRMLREIQEEANARFASQRIDQLSMGMSNDFEIAIEEGATYIRIGTGLFGERKNQNT